MSDWSLTWSSGSGCQSMGLRRFSKRLEGENFHLRRILCTSGQLTVCGLRLVQQAYVQTAAMRATALATAIIIIRAFLPKLRPLPPSSSSSSLLAAEAESLPEGWMVEVTSITETLPSESETVDCSTLIELSSSSDEESSSSLADVLLVLSVDCRHGHLGQCLG